MKGIDISTYQSNVDYNKLKADGIEFAIIRCGYGRQSNQKDKLFETHYQGLKNVGIKVGTYLYSYAQSIENAKQEAENCLNFIKGKFFDLPVFYDMEDSSMIKLGKDTLTAMGMEFCKIIEKAGYRAGIYANLNWFNNYLRVNSLLDYALWLAQWGINNHTASFRVDYWQYTSSGKVAGINGNVDMNICYNLNMGNNGVIANKKSNEDIAIEVINGLWGNGEDRKTRLTNAGYNYNTIQSIVNSALSNNVATHQINTSFNKGDKVKVLKNVSYEGTTLDKWVLNDTFDVIQVSGSRAVIGKGTAVTTSININNIKKV